MRSQGPLSSLSTWQLPSPTASRSWFRSAGAEACRPPAAAEAAGGAVPGGKVHLNSATIEQLDELPGVGPITAQQILDYRSANGAFQSVEELDAVPGIGPATLEQLLPLVDL